MTSTISRKLRVLALMMALVMVMPCVVGFGVAANVDDGLLTLAEVDEIGRLEAPATKANEAILKAWENENGEVVLPAAFGGCYITDDYKLGVKLVQGSPALRAEIESIVDDPSVLQFVTTTISLEGLFGIQDSLREFLPNADVRGSSVSVVRSQVNVILSEETLHTARFANPYINITYGSAGTLQATTTHNPGEMIAYHKNGEYKDVGTLGWYGYYKFTYNGEDTEDKLCFITAGHVVNEFVKENNVDMRFAGVTVFDGDYYDDGLYCIYQFGGLNEESATKGDYGILRCDTTSNTINESYLLKRTASATTTIEASLGTSSSASGNLELIEGKTVYKAYGKSGYNPGRVTAICCRTLGFPSLTGSETRYISGLVQVTSNTHTEFSIGGDSGAPIFFKDGGLTPTLVGLLTGGGADLNGNANPLISYFTPITILRDIGFEPYLPTS